MKRLLILLLLFGCSEELPLDHKRFVLTVFNDFDKEYTVYVSHSEKENRFDPNSTSCRSAQLHETIKAQSSEMYPLWYYRVCDHVVYVSLYDKPDSSRQIPQIGSKQFYANGDNVKIRFP